jgi:predicted nucleotidyltransferase
MDPLALTRSKDRAAILEMFFRKPGREYYQRELERVLGIPIGNVRRELLKLESAGLLNSRTLGNLRLFSVNIKYPLYKQCRDIVLRTVGIAGTLARTLASLRGVRFAFIFGSVAEGTDRADSDIDLLVVGTVGSRLLHEKLSILQDKLGREINVVLFSESELKKRISEKDHFVTSVLASTRVFIRGTDDEFRAALEGR